MVTDNAAGVMGRAAFSGGAGSVGLGAFLHFFIACGIAAVFYCSCIRWPVLIRRAVFSGAAYGVVVYVVMNHVIVPLSLARPAPFNPAWFLDNLAGHILLVGLPVALIARRSASRSQP